MLFSFSCMSKSTHVTKFMFYSENSSFIYACTYTSRLHMLSRIVRREANICIASNYRNPQKFQLQLLCNSHRNKIYFISELEATRTIVWVYTYTYMLKDLIWLVQPPKLSTKQLHIVSSATCQNKANRGFCLYYTRICKLTNSTDVISTIRVTSCMSLATFGGFSVTYSQSSANTTNLNCLL